MQKTSFCDLLVTMSSQCSWMSYFRKLKHSFDICLLCSGFHLHIVVEMGNILRSSSHFISVYNIVCCHESTPVHVLMCSMRFCYYFSQLLSFFTGSNENSAVDSRQSSNQVCAQQEVLLISLKSLADHGTAQHISEW